MKELLIQIDEMEQALSKVQEQAEYWLVEEHYDEAKSEQYEQEGHGKITGRTGRSGYCIYPVVKFDMEKVKEKEDVA